MDPESPAHPEEKGDNKGEMTHTHSQVSECTLGSSSTGSRSVVSLRSFQHGRFDMKMCAVRGE